MATRRTGAAVLPLVIVSQIVLYVALDGPLFRYRYPYQPLIVILGAAGLALFLQQIVTIWREAGSTTSDAAPAAALSPTVSPSVPRGTPQA